MKVSFFAIIAFLIALFAWVAFAQTDSITAFECVTVDATIYNQLQEKFFSGYIFPWEFGTCGGLSISAVKSQSVTMNSVAIQSHLISFKAIDGLCFMDQAKAIFKADLDTLNIAANQIYCSVNHWRGQDIDSPDIYGSKEAVIPKTPSPSPSPSGSNSSTLTLIFAMFATIIGAIVVVY